MYETIIVMYVQSRSCFGEMILYVVVAQIVQDTVINIHKRSTAFIKK